MENLLEDSVDDVNSDVSDAEEEDENDKNNEANEPDPPQCNYVIHRKIRRLGLYFLCITPLFFDIYASKSVFMPLSICFCSGNSLSTSPHAWYHDQSLSNHHGPPLQA